MFGLSESEQLQPICKWFNFGTCQPKIDKTYMFNQQSLTIHGVMQKLLKFLKLNLFKV